MPLSGFQFFLNEVLCDMLDIYISAIRVFLHPQSAY